MARISLIRLALLALGASAVAKPLCAPRQEQAIPKRRMIAMTDIAAPDREPDDQESVVHLLATADMFQIDAIISTTGWNYGSNPQTSRLWPLIDAYEKDLPNLMKRSGQTGFLEDETNQHVGYWPSADYLRSIIGQGQPIIGMVGVGDGLSTNGSKLITKVVDRPDPYNRPVWVSLWGSGNTLAQALWDVRQSRTSQAVDGFVRKIRVYAIADQDRPNPGNKPITTGLSGSSHVWMRKTFGSKLFFIWCEAAWRNLGTLTKNNWRLYAANIQGHGALGSQYPTYKFFVEGDTVSWLYPFPGISDPEDPSQSSWGGYFLNTLTPDNETYAFLDLDSPADDRSTAATTRIAEDERNDFISRINWAANGTGNRNPHLVVEQDDSYDVVVKNAVPGQEVKISAAGSVDPDGDDISYTWLQDTGVRDTAWTESITLRNSNTQNVSFKVPQNAAGYDIHLLLHGVDTGSPALGSWRRVIIRVRRVGKTD